jgi:hypothetical protein
VAFNYFVHAQHVGAGDNCLNFPYHLSSPLPIHDLPMHARRLLALLAIHNSNPHKYEIQCDSVSIEANLIGPEQLTQDADYELYSNPYCEYVKIVRIQGINAFALSALNNWIPCTEIHLTNEQAYSLILPNNAPTA